MGKMIRIVIILVLVFSIIGFYYTYERSKKQFESFEELRSSGEGTTTINEETQNLKECVQSLSDTGSDYIICSLDSNDKIYLTNDKKVFEPGDYFSIQVDLQKLNEYFDPYYTCTHSNFPNYPAETPEKYNKTSFLVHLSEDKGIEYETKACGKLFYQKDYHRISFSGVVADVPGQYTLLEVFVFPELNFNSKEEFFNNLDKGVLVFSLKGEIR